LSRLSSGDRPDLEALAPRYNLQHADDVYAAIGRGDLSPIQIAGLAEQKKSETRPLRPFKPRSESHPPRGEVVVEGVVDLMTSMARCCKPVPYDPIVGFITRGRGVTVHHRDCPNIRALGGEDRKRLVDVRWSEAQTENVYPVDILIHANDRKGLLRDISSILTNEEVDVIGVKTSSDRKRETASMRFTVEIVDGQQLRHLLAKVEQVPDVIDVKRQI
jgi:GTP pyrophosphokinase